VIRGFYTALSGIITSMTRQSVVADNLANVNTPGFKQHRTTATDFGFEIGNSLGWPMGYLGTATVPVGLTMDRAQGPFETTGLRTDLAIEGDGLFVVRTPTGIAYTRAGDFVLDATGTLTTQNGEPVLDTAGRPVVVPGGAAAFTVGPDGTVEGTGQRLALVAWPAGGVTRLGRNLLLAPGPLAPATGRIFQGAVERSNVDTALAMTELIGHQRAMGLSSRALSITDDTLGEANGIGRLRG
jgi:flagellar basal-body rod protein FlgG